MTYTEEQKRKIRKKWIESKKRARLTEEESRILADWQSESKQGTVDELAKILEDY